MKKYMSVASFTAAILFAAVGMAIPPKGVIDGSVLILAAQLFVLCATFLGIKDISLPRKPRNTIRLGSDDILNKFNKSDLLIKIIYPLYPL